MQKKLDETDTDFQQRKLAKQVEAAEASKKVTEDEQAAKEKITETHTQARIGAEQSMQNAMQQTLNATKADTNTRKAIAVATIAINEAESIAAAVASATKGDPYTIAMRIAAAVASVVAAMMQASSALSGASGYATGGYVSFGLARKATSCESVPPLPPTWKLPPSAKPNSLPMPEMNEPSHDMRGVSIRCGINGTISGFISATCVAKSLNGFCAYWHKSGQPAS